MRPAIEHLQNFFLNDHPPNLEWLRDYMAKLELTHEEKEEIGPLIKKVYQVEDPFLSVRIQASNNHEDFIHLMNRIGIKGWLHDVVMVCEEMESPANFNFGSALAIMGAALRRRVYVDFGFFKIWPAVQVGLIGHSSISKTTGGDWLYHEVAKHTHTFNKLPDEGSAEGLKMALANLTKKDGEATGLLWVGELATYMSRTEYMLPLVQTLNDLFDSRPAKLRVVVSRQDEGPMENIAISAILATNEKNLAKAIPTAALDSGLFGRVLLFHRVHEPKVRPIPKISQEVISRLQGGLTLISQIKGEAVLTNEAIQFYSEDLYLRYKDLQPEDENLQAFVGRLRTHCPRLAMLFAISENPHDGPAPPMIEKRHLEAAHIFLMWLYEQLPGIYAYIGNTQWGIDRDIILAKLKKGKLTDDELRRKMPGMRGTVLMEHMADLQLARLVKKDGDKWVLVGRFK